MVSTYNMFSLLEFSFGKMGDIVVDIMRFPQT